MRQYRSRREVLKLSVVMASAGVPACYRAERETAGGLSELESERNFPQSLASGDPRPESVMLWVRVADTARPTTNLSVQLIVALDEAFEQRIELGSGAARLAVMAAADHCLAVRLAGLEPGTTYYYRFRYEADLGTAQTRVGRTKTAPAANADVPLRFAVVCCQDYVGKYFHAHRHVAEQELDFVVHLGDYVYETAADPDFQSPTETRRVVFSAPDEALTLADARGSYLAARSLSNYRDLYKLYRSDPDLQALHERHPVIAIWDDHEFSDDSHGESANYQDGLADEASPERRAAADQAWFEYMPVDYAEAPATSLDPAAAFPGNFSIYRSFSFGQHLELFMTDLRRFRPDHLVPEDAPPGVVFLTQAELEAQVGDLPVDAVPYVDVETFAKGAYQASLRDNAELLQLTPEKVTGLISAVWINSALSALAALDQRALPEPIELTSTDLERGYAYHCLLKSSEFSRVGSRYLVASRPFEALARKRFDETDGQSERLMGDTQRAWFTRAVADSSRTFKVWGSGIAFLSRHIDLTGVTLAPPELQTRISISTEDWDGFPNERSAILAELAQAGNVVILSGDLHCFFAGTPHLPTDPDARVVEFVTGSVSSTTWLEGIKGFLAADPALPAGAQLLASSVGALLADTAGRTNPHLAYQELARNGYSLVEVNGAHLSATMYTLSPEDVATPPGELASSIDALMQTARFRVPAGSAELERELDGEFLRWSLEKMAFV